VILQAEPRAAVAGLEDHPPPAAVRLEYPRVGLVAEGVIQQADQSVLDVGIVDRHDHLDPPIEVPLHHVGGADGYPERPAVGAAETEDA
jgi:hypothetical protein